MSSDPTQFALLDRASGVLLGQACGDALGVPHELAHPPVGETQMRGGPGRDAPGEWSHDTQLAICIARVSERGGGLRTAAELDEIAAAFEDRFAGGASAGGTQTARTAGNGALMRTGVVALVALDDREATAQAATAVAQLTHADPLAAQSCVLWSEAIRVAVTESRLDVRAGLDLLPAGARPAWGEWIADAEQVRPRADLTANGFTVTALQAAWHAIFRSPYFSPGETTEYDHMVSHLPDSLHRAARIGGGTDTVAAIAGALLGARHGTKYIAPEWAQGVHGWPGMSGIDVSRLGRLTAQRGLGARATGQTCPVCGVYGKYIERYPDSVCDWCASWATDEDGRPVWLSNTSFSGGFDAHYANGKPASVLARSGQVFISGRPFRASAAQFGGVVVEAVAG